MRAWLIVTATSVYEDNRFAGPNDDAVKSKVQPTGFRIENFGLKPTAVLVDEFWCCARVENGGDLKWTFKLHNANKLNIPNLPFVHLSIPPYGISCGLGPISNTFQSCHCDHSRIFDVLNTQLPRFIFIP